jgi:hypothetical protein
MKVSKLWEILGRFKNFCSGKGWKISQTDDWVETDEQYHNFLWAREVNPESFKKIASYKKCVVRDGLSYHVVHAAYTAWLFPETPPDCLIRTVRENPDFSKRIALYDLSRLAEGKNLCAKLNSTDSCVFRGFEDFLKDELKVKMQPITNITAPDVERKAYTAPGIA